MNPVAHGTSIGPLGTHQSAVLGKCDAAVRRTLGELEQQRFVTRLWARDPTLWKSQDPALIRDRLGWLTVIEAMRGETSSLRSFADGVKKAGFTHALLLGMGGSSLCAEVLRLTFGISPGFLDLKVLDSTDPDAVLQMEESLPLSKTLFIVSTKSGTTTETLALYEYFFEKVKALTGDGAGKQFIAITDGGSPLEKIARAKVFHSTFLNPSDIGGRYSALSYFGLVPAALAGVDTEKLLGRAKAMADACNSSVPIEKNPALYLGAVLAALGQEGRDKITFILSPGIASFGSWVEQLLAESTGKEGTGFIPVVDEPLGPPRVYGDDRLFVHIGLNSDQADGAKLKALEEAGHPVVKIVLRDIFDLGAEFFRWEIATAVAGAILGINPFNEPNVQESKDNTKQLLKEFLARGSFPRETALAQEGGATLYGDQKTSAKMKQPGDGLKGLLAAHLRQAQPNDYVALLAYLHRSAKHDALLQEIRHRLRDKLRVATTLGYGPRYLHSTGQLHKGGPNTALILQIVDDPAEELPVPETDYSFRSLIRAQALGDYEALKQRGRRVLRVNLGGDVAGGLRRLGDALRG